MANVYLNRGVLSGGLAAVFAAGLSMQASAAPLFSDDFQSYAFGENAGGAAMAANGWVQTAAGSGGTTNFGGAAPNYALHTNASRAGFSVGEVTQVTVDFDLWGAHSPATDFPFTNGIDVFLVDSDTGDTATFRFAANFLYGGTNTGFFGGFQFSDGTNQYAATGGQHMANSGYAAFVPRSASLTYDTDNDLVSLSYNGTTMFSETLGTDFGIDEVYFASAFVSNNGSSATAADAPWVIDNVVVTGVPEPASLALLAMGGVAMLGRRRK